MKLSEIFSELPYVLVLAFTPTIKEEKKEEDKSETNKWERFLNYLKFNESSDVLEYKPVEITTISEKPVEKSNSIKASSNEKLFSKNLLTYLNDNAEIRDLLNPKDIQNIKNIVLLESSFKKNSKATSKNGSTSYGYFQINDSNFKYYGISNSNEFLVDTDKQMEVGCKHYLSTKKELQNLKYMYPDTPFTDFQLIYGLWFTGYSNMVNFLNNGSITTDGTTDLRLVMDKAKKIDEQS